MTEPAPRARWGLHLGLFLATALTTTITGALYAGQGPLALTQGLSFSLPLMAILLCHELGHYVAAKVHGVPASLPYFIPLPPGIGPFGTMGAVITQAGTKDRRRLIDIGAAGPLAGLAVAIPVLHYGLTLSEVGPVRVGFQEGNSIFYLLLKYWVKGAWLPGEGRDVFLHPTAFAGWAGLFITMLNLIPIGQLDGGHIATAYFGNRYRRVARLFHQALPWLALVVFGWVYRQVKREALAGFQLPDGMTPLRVAMLPVISWFVLYGLLWVLGRATQGLDHPPVDDERALPAGRQALFWVVAIVFALIFMPVPLRPGLGAPPTHEGGGPPAGGPP